MLIERFAQSLLILQIYERRNSLFLKQKMGADICSLPIPYKQTFELRNYTSSNFLASTYWAMPTATRLASFMANTTVWGVCTTSPPANTPLRVVMP